MVVISTVFLLSIALDEPVEMASFNELDFVSELDIFFDVMVVVTVIQA